MLICSLTLLIQATSCMKQQEQEGTNKTELVKEDRSSTKSFDYSLIEAEPRQYFRLHSISSPSNNSSSYKRIQLASLKKRRQALGDQLNKMGEQTKKAGKFKKSPSGQTTIIKSLNQGSPQLSASSFKSPNFKFVFIQRATAIPKSANATAPTAATTTTSTDPGSPSKSSLAASVSKQLANSLLNSAASIVLNMTAPSLSSLLNAQPTPLKPTQTSSHTTNEPSTTNKLNDEGSSDSGQDLKRVQTATVTATSTKTSSRPKRPSKIYNLPVKFVSNGHPNSLMFNTIKQHFATIKKLQLGSTKLTNSNYNYQSSSSSAKKKLRPKLKGNSRLIYLPLSYLSNAKPLTGNRLLTKATHKSTTVATSR